MYLDAPVDVLLEWKYLAPKTVLLSKKIIIITVLQVNFDTF